MDKIVADPVLSDYLFQCLARMLMDNPVPPTNMSPDGDNPTGASVIHQLDADACLLGLQVLEKLKSRRNWETMKNLHSILDKQLWRKRAQSEPWRKAYARLYDRRAFPIADYMPAKYDDSTMGVQSFYEVLPSP